MRVLGIETSCDETAVCLLEAEGDFGTGFQFKVLGNALLSQIEVHREYGGVFPNLAKREHQKNLVPVMEAALKQAGLLIASGHAPDVSQEKSNGVEKILERETELFAHLSLFLTQHKKPNIDCVAVTAGPGLEPALWVGINFAKALSLAWDVPIVAVNHMEGHIIISAVQKNTVASIEFPLLSLLISGGHTELVLSKKWMTYELIGETQDDAVGEAFDKVARVLGLSYPGGPEISRLAEKAREENSPRLFELPRPMMHTDTFDFSFSGLKTAVRRIVEKESPLSDHAKCQLAREFEDAAAEVLIAKTIRAADERGAKTVLIGGGVSANNHIRKELTKALHGASPYVKLLIPSPELATDNAIMIAIAGYFYALKKNFVDPKTLVANGNLRLV